MVKLRGFLIFLMSVTFSSAFLASLTFAAESQNGSQSVYPVSSELISKQNPTNKPEDKEIYLDVGRAGTKKHRIVIAPFLYMSEVQEGANSQVSKKFSEDLPTRLKDILDFTKGFEFLVDENLVRKNFSVGSSEPQYDDWQVIKADSLLTGSFQKTGPDLYSSEFKFYSVSKKKLILGKRYLRVKSKNFDGVLRRFADLIMEKLTGELGIFSSKLAFVGTYSPGKPRQIFTSLFDGSHLQQITDDNAIHMSPAWSPDGTKLAYTSFKSGKAEIYIYNLLTKKHVRLTYSASGNNSGANWHPDGKWIAFASGLNGVTSIFSTNALTGGQKTSLISGSGLEVEPAYSPDGRFMAFASGRFGNPHIFVRDLTSVKDTRITYAGWYNSSPSWRPDSRKLAFAGYDKDIDRYDIFLVNPDGRQLERLTLNQGDNERPQWSPDGRFLAFQSNRGVGPRGKARTYKIFVMNKDGGDQRPLTIPLADAVMPAWGPRMTEFEEE